MNDIHKTSNELIAAMGPQPIGDKDGVKIFKLAFEKCNTGIRSICYDENEAIIQIADACEFKALRNHLAVICNIGLKYSDMVWANTQLRWEAFEEAELFNQAAKDLSPGLINQFEANGFMYSVVHAPAFKTSDSHITNGFYTGYIQNAAIADPDECLVDTQSFDTLFEAVAYIRDHIEISLMKAFLPELFQ